MSAPSRILVVKLCCVGDVVMLTPALRALRNSFPSARISYLASSWVKDVVEQTGFVDEVIIFDAPFVRGIRRLLSTLRLLLDLRRRHFDLAVIAHRRSQFALLAFLAGVTRRVGFGPQAGLLLTDAVAFEPNAYEIDRYLALAGAAGAESAGSHTELLPDRRHSERADEALRELGVTPGELLIAFFPGGGENPGTSMHIKRWSPESYARLAARALGEFPAKILFLGGPQDDALNKGILDTLGRSAGRAVNLSARISFALLPSVLGKCAAVVGGDSGTLHLAAAVGVPTLFLFGPSDPRLVAPRMPNVQVLWKHPECSPCYTPESIRQKQNFRGTTFLCRTGTHECLDLMTVDEVFDALRAMFTVARQRSGPVHASS